ncbi:MAG: tetratricopeptide repeat protein [Elusimicrobiota bacterium]
MASSHIEKAKEYLRDKNYKKAISFLIESSRKDPRDSRIYFLLARSYLSAGKNEKSDYSSSAESALRKALKIEPLNEKYHDLLIEIKASRNKLDELSREYRRKLNEKSDPLYESLLQKISAVSMISIPEPKTKRKKSKHKGYYIIHYFVMPVTAACAAALWLLGDYAFLRNLATFVVLVYLIGRIALRPRSKKYENW